MFCVRSGCGMGRARSLTVRLLDGLAAIHTRHRKCSKNVQVSSHHGVFWRSTSLPSSSRARACSCHQRQPIWDLLPWWTCTSPVGNDTTISSTTSHWLITFCCGVDVVVLCRPPHEAAAMVVVAGGAQLSVSSGEPGAAGASIGSGGAGASAAAAMTGGVDGGSADAGDDEPPKKKGKKRSMGADQRANLARQRASA